MPDNKGKVDLSNPTVEEPTETKDFHDALEAAIEPNLKSKPAVKQDLKPADNKTEPEEKTVASDWEALYKSAKSDLDNTSKRYDESSKHGKQLAQELDELKPYSPLLDLIGKEPELRNYIENYAKTGGKPAEEKVDFDEILTDEEKFNQAVESRVDAKLKAFAEQNQKQTSEEKRRENILRERQRYQEDRGYTDEQMSELDEYAKNTTIDYAKLDVLKNHKAVDKKKDEAAFLEKFAHLVKTHGLPPSLAGVPNTQVDESPNDQLMKVFHNLDGQGVEKLLG